MKPKLTVLMTVFNGERYLKECIDSVLNQTFKDFEFLIIDDCSTDSSIDIINSYKDKRIRVIENQKNLSQVKSLNMGLDEASGEYVARIDQDDLMIENRLERQLDFLNKRPDIAVVGTWGEVMDARGQVFERSRLPIRQEEIIGSVLFCGYFLMHPSVMFRKDSVVSAGKYKESLSLSEDFDLWARLLLKGYKLANIPEFLIRFRYHKKSSSRLFPEKRLNNARSSISNFISVIIGEGSNPKLDKLSNVLINTGLMNKGFWSNGREAADLKDIIYLLDTLLEKTIAYFNFSKKEIYFIKKVFCNRILNFAFQACGTEDQLSMKLYLYSFKSCFFILENPKLYIYPLIKIFSYMGRK